MSTALQTISIEEYLDTSYSPDREYIDGEVRERNVGTWEHSRVQALLAIWFGQHESQWGVMVSTEWRTRVSGTRVRIPDLVVVRAGRQDSVLQTAPLLFIEILSPNDSYSDTERRASDYMVMGATAVWIVDPETSTGRMCQGDAWVRSSRLEVPGTPVYVELDGIFADIDRARPAE